MLSICATIKNRYFNKFCDLDSYPLYNSLFSIFLHLPRILETFGSYEIVISDFSSTDFDLSSLHRTYPFNHMNLKFVDTGTTEFSRGLGLNVAYNASVGDVILFTDVDMVVEDGSIFKYIKDITDEGKSYFPYICKRTPQNKDFRKIDKGGVWTNNGCGICVVNRTVVDKTKRFENKKTYGGEDIVFMNECGKHSIVVRSKLYGYTHYPHSRIPWKDV